MLRLIRFYKLFLGLFPKSLPTGAQELVKFSDDIFELYSIPALPSYRLAIATMMMHLGPQAAFKSPFWFFRSIRAAQNKEVAYQLVADDRELRNQEEREAKQKAFDAKLEASLQQAAVSAQSQVAIDANNQSQAV